MLVLKVALLLKIFLTLFWALIPLLFPLSWFESLGVPAPEPELFLRLLGAAYLALLVGYLLGAVDFWNGRRIRSTLWVGIVSNGLACLLIFLFGLTGALSDWGQPARDIMWISAMFAGQITALLLIGGWHTSMLFGVDKPLGSVWR
jgi:hypothetical protein